MALDKKKRLKDDPPNTYGIFPDYWKDSWGEKPFLGFVSAYSKFEAIRQAYTRGLVRKNFTFAPEPVLFNKYDVKKYKASMRKGRKYRRKAH